MTHHHDGASRSFRNGGDIFQHGANLIGTVHINFPAEITLNGIEDHQPCAGLHDGSFDPFIQQSKRTGILCDVQHPVLICARFHQPGLDGVAQSIFRCLVDHIERLCGFHSGKRLPGGTGCRQAQRKGGLALAGIALNDGDLSEGDVGIPQPADFLQFHLGYFYNPQLRFLI